MTDLQLIGIGLAMCVVLFLLVKQVVKMAVGIVLLVALGAGGAFLYIKGPPEDLEQRIEEKAGEAVDALKDEAKETVEKIRNQDEESEGENPTDENSSEGSGGSGDEAEGGSGD